MDNKHDFTQGSIFKKMIQFMLPILGALILQAMYGAVDLLIVGKFGTNAGISGVSIGSSIMNLVTFVLCALASGVTILISRYLGEKKYEQIGNLIGGAIAFFLLFSVVMTIILVIFARPIAVLMQAPEEAMDLTAQYIRICGGGCVFIVFYNLISCIFRGLGDSKMPLLFVGIACVVNIVGDLILIAWLDMNVAGAAFATIFAQAVSVILSLLIIRKRKMNFSFSIKDIHFGKEVSAFVQVGAPLALQEILTNVSFLALCAFINRLGLDAANGYGIAQKLTSFILLIPSSLMQCMASFVAQNVGARKEDRAKRGMYYGMTMGVCIGVVIGTFVFFKGDLLASIFSNNEQDIARAFEYLRGFALEPVITCILFSFMGYFNGHSRSMFVMLQGLAQSFLIRLPMSYIMSIQPDASLTHIGLAAPTATVFGIILCTLYYVHMNKQEQTYVNSLTSVESKGFSQQIYNPTIPTVITIGRTYGAGGRTVGKMVARRLGIPFYDKNLLSAAAEKCGLSVQYLSAVDEKADVLHNRLYVLDQPETIYSMAHKAQKEVITQVAEAGGCVIVGRRADQILAEKGNVLRVFVNASVDKRAERIMKRDDLTMEKAKIKIRKVDKERADYYNSISGYGWGEAASYDLCLNTDQFGVEGVAELIVAAVGKQKSI